MRLVDHPVQVYASCVCASTTVGHAGYAPGGTCSSEATLYDIVYAGARRSATFASVCVFGHLPPFAVLWFAFQRSVPDGKPVLALLVHSNSAQTMQTCPVSPPARQSLRSQKQTPRRPKASGWDSLGLPRVLLLLQAPVRLSIWPRPCRAVLIRGIGDDKSIPMLLRR